MLFPSTIPLTVVEVLLYHLILHPRLVGSAHIWNILRLKNYSLFIYNSIVSGYPVFLLAKFANPSKETGEEKPDGKRNEPCDCQGGQCAESQVSSDERGRR